MEWMEWVKMAVRVRWETRKARGRAGVAGISRPSMSRYERGDCPLQERLEEWARGLGMDVAQAVAAWQTRYEAGLIADCAALRPGIAWRAGKRGAVLAHVSGAAPRTIRDLRVWRKGASYVGRLGCTRARMVKAPTLAGVLDVLAPVSA